MNDNTETDNEIVGVGDGTGDTMPISDRVGNMQVGDSFLCTRTAGASARYAAETRNMIVSCARVEGRDDVYRFLYLHPATPTVKLDMDRWRKNLAKVNKTPENFVLPMGGAT